MHNTIRTGIYAGLLGALALSQTTLAQNTLEEVVVTATKRSVSLDDFSGGANVIGADDLGPGGIENVRDMLVAVPNMSIGDQFGFARVFMRGIGMTSIDIGGEGAVSFLQDGAIVPRPAAQLMGMFDLAQDYRYRGMAAYAELQDAEFASEVQGYTATRHQREVGTGYFDMVREVISGGVDSTAALEGSTEAAQF